MFSNIRGLSKEKVKYIEKDFGFMSADIIFLSECHIRKDRCEHIYKLKGYRF